MSERDLIAENTELVKKIAGGVKRKLPSYISFDELFQSGMIGLWKAAREHKAEMDAGFRTYAGLRIKGEIIEEVRRIIPFSRCRVKKYSFVEFMEEDCDHIDQSIVFTDPCEQLKDRQLNEIVSEEIERLEGRSATAFHLYRKGVLLKKIGEKLGVSESRASQLVTGATALIREHLSRRLA